MTQIAGPAVTPNAEDLTPGGDMALAWWRDCTCDPEYCAYDDGDCPLCRLLNHSLPCPRDELLGLNQPASSHAHTINGDNQ